MIRKIKKHPYFITNWVIFFILSFLGMREFLVTNILAYVPVGDLLTSKRFLVYLVVCGVLLLSWTSVFFFHSRPSVQKHAAKIKGIPSVIKIILSATLVLLPAVIMWIFPVIKDFTLHAWMMFFLIYCVSLLTASLYTTRKSIKERYLILAILIMAGGFGYAFFARMDQVTSYPFPTYWSEGNRFFDYSTLLGSFRYNIPQGESIKAFINWGMALPWALPFVIPNISISFYRLWYQLVWIIPVMLLGFFTIDIRKEGRTSVGIAAVFALWSFLFLNQGPIYPPLVIGAIITVIASRQRLSVAMILVIVASYYVRSARWTWGYAPGLWAGLLALLAIDNPSLNKERVRELLRPILLGLSGYFGGHLLPRIIHMIRRGSELRLLPNPTGSVSRQPLIWDRLWPNPTYPPGIVLGMVWAVLPVILFLLAVIIKKYWRINWIQKISAAAIAIAFGVVGIIASTKIGGGSNLHNLDMFLIAILLLFLQAINASNRNQINIDKFTWLTTLLLVTVLITPVTYALRQTERLLLPPAEKIEESLLAVQNKVDEFSEKGEILFIDHRQLLTFNIVKNVPLIEDYEKKYLMDNALTANRDFFIPFYKDIANHRFALIVNEPLNVIVRGDDYAFGEENDAYVKWVTTPLFCQYEPIYTSQAAALELLIPRTSPAPDYLDCEQVFLD